MVSSSKTTTLSIVSPVYKANKIIPELVKQIVASVIDITDNYEIILVDDGCPDSSWDRILEECKKNEKVKGIKLSRNFGQHYALSAGLKSSIGEYTVVLDCDLQDNPKYIHEMYLKAKGGYDVVYALQKNRNHSFLKNVFATIFYWIFNKLTDNKKADANLGSYTLLSRKALDVFNAYKESHRHYLHILSAIGFSSAYINVEHNKRYEGKSSYSFSKLLNHAIDGMVSSSDWVLRKLVMFGFVFFFFSIIGAMYLVYSYFSKGAFPGYTSMMVFLLFSTGILLTSIGIVGVYIGKIYIQVKDRPLYVIDKQINF